MKHGLRSLLLAATLLAACGGAALVANGNGEAEAKAAPIPMQTAASGWAGRYEGREEGGTGSVTIAPGAGGAFKIELEVATPGCGGEASGNGRLVGTALVLRPGAGKDQCRITIHRTVSGVITEESDCFDYHGAQCSFSFQARRMGAVAAAPKLAAGKRSAPAPLPRDALCPPACSYNTGALAGSMPASRPAPAPSQEREVAYQADGYTVYWEEPGYCTLYLDAPGQVMVRMSYRPANDAVNFSYVREGGVRTPPNDEFHALFQFDATVEMQGFGAKSYSVSDGRSGFALLGASSEFLDMWARNRFVSIRLGNFSATPVARLALNGSQAAVSALRRCARRAS